MTNAAVVLDAVDVSVGFPDGRGVLVDVVRNLSLSVRAGEFVGLMGAPGCGKSIAAAAMFGVVRVPGRITGGRVHLLGHDITHAPESVARRVRGNDAAIIMQNPRYSLHPMLAVGSRLPPCIARTTRCRAGRPGRTRWRCCAGSASMIRSVGPARCRTSYPAAWRNAC